MHNGAHGSLPGAGALAGVAARRVRPDPGVRLCGGAHERRARLGDRGARVWRLRHVEIEFGREGVGFGFGGIRRRVPRERIVGAEPRDYPVIRYMGWGYRFGWEPRDRAYSVLGCRRGVLLTFDDERGRRWKVFLSSRAPEKAVAALEA